jgi:hypothetical protein
LIDPFSLEPEPKPTAWRVGLITQRSVDRNHAPLLLRGAFLATFAWGLSRSVI